MNRLFIIGNLTRDPETRTTQSGKEVCSFTVAVNRRKRSEGNQPDADFFRVSAWDELGKNCQKYLAKARKVAVLGEVSVRQYQGSDGTPKCSMEVMARDVEFLTPKGEDGGYAGSAAPAATQSAPAAVGGTIAQDDDLPF